MSKTHEWHNIVRRSDPGFDGAFKALHFAAQHDISHESKSADGEKYEIRIWGMTAEQAAAIISLAGRGKKRCPHKESADQEE